MIAPPNRRPWYQFSVRTLILLTTIVSVALAWLVYERNELRKRKAVIVTIEKLGGKLKFDTSQPFRESWLRPLLSDKPVNEVVGVSWESKRVTDAELVNFNSLSRLRWLDLDYAQIKGTGLVHLAKLSELDRLSLRETAVTDAGLVHLEGLAKLENLWLGYTQVTDAGLVHLAGLRGLEQLDLEHTQVTDAGLAQLRGLTALKELRLYRTQVTDQGANELKKALPDLQIKR